MKVKTLKDSDLDGIDEFSKLSKTVIYNTPYYSKKALELESHEYDDTSILLHLLEKDVFHLYLIAYDSNKPVGFLHGYDDFGCFWINWIGFLDIARRNGYATFLLKKLESILKGMDKDIHKIWLDTRTNNKESIGLFLKNGYNIVTVLKNHWYNSDFYLWEKQL